MFKENWASKNMEHTLPNCIKLSMTSQNVCGICILFAYIMDFLLDGLFLFHCTHNMKMNKHLNLKFQLIFYLYFCCCCYFRKRRIYRKLQILYKRNPICSTSHVFKWNTPKHYIRISLQRNFFQLHCAKIHTCKNAGHPFKTKYTSRYIYGCASFICSEIDFNSS